jgi:hypothetical protein
MRIHHRRLHSFVAQQLLYRPEIVALLEQMRRNAVSKGMATEAFGKLCQTARLATGPLETTLMGVMPADGPRAGVSRQLVGGKHLLPNPESAGTWIFSFQCQRSIDGAIAFG